LSNAPIPRKAENNHQERSPWIGRNDGLLAKHPDYTNDADSRIGQNVSAQVVGTQARRHAFVPSLLEKAGSLGPLSTPEKAQRTGS